jgi:hypothetical protein
MELWNFDPVIAQHNSVNLFLFCYFALFTELNHNSIFNPVSWSETVHFLLL